MCSPHQADESDTLKAIVVVSIWLFSAATADCVASEDAATQVQEGDVRHWIEYYEKERARSNDTVTRDTGDPKAESANAADEEVDPPAAQAQPPESTD